MKRRSTASPTVPRRTASTELEPGEHAVRSHPVKTYASTSLVARAGSEAVDLVLDEGRSTGRPWRSPGAMSAQLDLEVGGGAAVPVLRLAAGP